MSFRIGLVGTGGIAGGRLAPAIRTLDGVELWSVMSRNLNRAQQFARRHGASSPTPAYDELQALLDDPELDGVLLATPDKLHADQIMAAAASGKHVLVEKPMATDFESATAAVEACRQAGVTLAVAYHLRHHAGLKAVHRRVQAGELGRVHHARMQWTYRADDALDWRAADDVGRWWSLAGVGTHILDQVLWFLTPTAGDVEEISSVISRARFGGPHDETAVVALQFTNGATAELTSSVLFDAPSRFELYADNGYVIGEDVLNTVGDGDLWINDELLRYRPCNPYAAEIQDFVEAARQDVEPAVSGEAALRNVEILLAASPLD